MLKIIFENKNLLVINKPAGINVHPAFPGQKNTLVDQILKEYPEIKKVGEDSLRPGIIHRLDKDTSGLLIIAKNNQAFNFLKQQFQNRKIIKKYLALVHGQVKENRGTITKSISLSKKDHKKRTPLLTNKSQKAWTEYKVIKRYKDYTLLKAFPKTGRTHQIRIHLASIGHPICRDKQYQFKRQKNPTNLTHQFLHAEYLKFESLNGKIIELESSLPKDLAQVLNNLKETYESN